MVLKVAIIGTRGYPSYYGGFETAVRRLAPFLADRGWQVTVYGQPGQVRRDDPNRDMRVEVVTTLGLAGKSTSTLTYGFFSCLHALWQKPDVALVMNCANGFWLPLLRLRGIPVLTNVDGIEWERQKWGRLAKYVFRLGARFTARYSKGLVFDARGIEDYWCEHFGREGYYIPYGGDPVGTLELQDEVESKKYLLVVARFVPENTIAEILEASVRLSEHLDVVLVGTSGVDGPLDRLAASLSVANARIHWLKHISDDKRLFALWQHAAVYFHGHSVGGTNPALVQAMAIGTNIVARDTIYNREVLGECALFCEPTPESIICAVEAALNEPGDRAGAAKDRARTMYSWELVCARYLEALELTARGSGS